MARLILLWIGILSLAVDAQAFPQKMCKSRILDAGVITGTLGKVEKLEKDGYAIIYLNDNTEFTGSIPARKTETYSKMIGKKVSIKYQLLQRWDKHLKECAREEVILEILPE